jgi:GAF domain-containing protein
MLFLFLGVGMKRSVTTGSKATKARSRKAADAKRRPAPASPRLRQSSDVDLPEQYRVLTRELIEARELQSATAEVLRVISISPNDVQPVFDTIAESAVRLCQGQFSFVLRFDNGLLSFGACHGLTPEGLEAFRRDVPRPAGDDTASGRAILYRAVAQIPDVLADSNYGTLRLAETVTFRSILAVPMLRNGHPIGTIAVARSQVGPFSAGQIALLQTFANQAVIAIENARLFNEVQAKTRDLSETLQQQTATADVLKVISRSAFDLKPVLDTLVQSAACLCDADKAFIFQRSGNVYVQAANYRFSRDFEDFARQNPIKIELGTITGRVAIEGRIVHVADVLDDPEYTGTQYQSRGHYRTGLGVPLLRATNVVGVFFLSRSEVRPFTQKQIELVTTFADQAVIAIENVRLFNETQEALERQTATADILRVIATSPSDVQPVFKAIAERSKRLVNALSTTVFRLSDDVMHLEAFTPTNSEADAALQAMFPAPLSTFSWAESVRRGEIFRVADTEDELDTLRDVARLRGFRSMLLVPLVRDGTPIGLISVTRVEPGPFANHHVHMLQTFADQALIAIENARLFDELQTRTRDLAESLEQQTATSEVLQVISSSPGELGPVFEQMLEKATRVCGASFGTLNLFDGERFETVALYNVPPVFAASRKRALISPHPEGGLSYVARTKQVAHIHDLRLSPAYRDGSPAVIEFADVGGARTVIIVPMLKENELTGTITIYRKEVRPFTEKQMELVANFAKQAVIAIENTRLLKELRQRTEDLSESLQQQTATADVLKVISASPGELEPVFQAMLENAVRLCEAKFAQLFLYYEEENVFRAVGKWNLPPAWSEFLGKNSLCADPMVPLGRVAVTKQPVQISDVLADQAYIDRYPGMVAVAELGGARTLLQVPMLRENELVGAFGIYRQQVRPFTDKQIALVQNFAAQAVIAIENARLLNELRQRTDDLTRSLEDLRTAQDRLVQTEKLASLGQLTAGIAHEIKNPLNFVNNFSALSAELTHELNDILKSAAFGEKMRGEVNELTGLLKDNLEKVVQHGKRADSIVKNMLLHSREGSGEHRSADINALVEESLNLAYHGARAEKSGFSITFKRDLDPDAGAAEVYPQEVTRAPLNLISNGFYAATKHKSEADDETFEPVLSATTRSLGNRVEIRIRDNGTGIPPEVREKIFNPFFTTKPAGEGTGLGLSMSHDIIVKQHGGSISVETEPGVFTEFIITLPRGGTASDSKPE